MRGAGIDDAGTARRLPADGLAMWVMGGLLGRVTGQHVIDEDQETLEALRC